MKHLTLLLLIIVVTPALSADDPHIPSRIRVGVSGNFDGNWGNVPGPSIATSSGIGFGFGLQGIWRINDCLELVVSPGYQHSSLSRTIDGTGQILDANPAKFSQTVQSFSLTSSLSIALYRNRLDDEGHAGPNYWWDAGVEGLLPFSSNLSNNFSESVSVANEKLLMILTGPHVDFLVLPNRTLIVGALVFYNVGSRGGDKYFGARAQVALQLSGLLPY